MSRPDPRPVTAPPAPPRSELASPPSSVPARSDDGTPTDGAAHQLPAHRGKVGRVTDHVKGAADSLTDWFELRIALLKREVKDEVQAAKEQAAALGKAYGMAAVLALVAALVLLFVLGFLFSALWGLLLGTGHELWSLTLGYLTLTLLLGLGALLAFRKARRTQERLPMFNKERADEPS